MLTLIKYFHVNAFVLSITHIKLIVDVHRSQSLDSVYVCMPNLQDIARTTLYWLGYYIAITLLDPHIWLAKICWPGPKYTQRNVAAVLLLMLHQQSTTPNNLTFVNHSQLIALKCSLRPTFHQGLQLVIQDIRRTLTLLLYHWKSLFVIFTELLCVDHLPITTICSAIKYTTWV